MDNFNPHYNDCYFSTEGGLDESLWVFINGNEISRFSCTDNIYAGETGFGSGLNFLALCIYINGKIKDYSGILDYFSCEKYPLSPEKVSLMLSPFFREDRRGLDRYLEFYSSFFSSLSPGLNSCEFELFSVKTRLTLFYGEAAEGLSLLEKNRNVWFLDGHDPEKNPDMWSCEIFSLLAEKSSTGTTLATYTSKGLVKQGLRKAGFIIRRKKGFGKKRHMITGIYKPLDS